MTPDRDQDRTGTPQNEQTSKEVNEKQHSSAFNETSRGDKKSTKNIEEEADLEQQRKEALTERD